MSTHTLSFVDRLLGFPDVFCRDAAAVSITLAPHLQGLEQRSAAVARECARHKVFLCVR
jgi:hypothetical protein